MKDKIFNRLSKEGISARYLALKEQNGVKGDIGMLKHLEKCLRAIYDKNNIILLGGVGRGKSFLAYELAYTIKTQNIDKYIYCERVGVIVSKYKANFSNLSILDEIFTSESYYFGEKRAKNALVILDELDDLKDDDYKLLNEIVIEAYESLTPLILISNMQANTFFKLFSDKALSRLNENSLILNADSKDLRQ